MVMTTFYSCACHIRLPLADEALSGKESGFLRLTNHQWHYCPSFHFMMVTEAPEDTAHWKGDSHYYSGSTDARRAKESGGVRKVMRESSGVDPERPPCQRRL